MKNTPSANEEYFKKIVALSRIIMPQMNIQIPPNLSPRSYQSFLQVGINDWGGNITTDTRFCKSRICLARN